MLLENVITLKLKTFPLAPLLARKILAALWPERAARCSKQSPEKN